MSSEYDTAANRRRFLQYLAASPLLVGSGASALAETMLPRTMLPDPLMWGPRQADHLIKSPKEAINVFDLEPVCRQNVPPAHFGYMASGIDDEVTLRANREGFLKFQFRPRRLVDVSKVDMSVDILGTKYSSPIVCAPVGGQRSLKLRLDDEVTAPVLLVAGLAAVVAERTLLAIGDGSQASAIDPKIRQVVHDDLRSLLCKHEVIGGTAALVAMPFHLQLDAGVGAQPLSIAAQHLASLLADRPTVIAEVDVAEPRGGRRGLLSPPFVHEPSGRHRIVLGHGDAGTQPLCA